MKKPRLPSEEELAEWRAANRGTKKSKRRTNHSTLAMGVEDAIATVPLPLWGREGPTQWEGEGAVKKSGDQLQGPLTHPSPARGEGLRKTPLTALPLRDAKRVFKSHSVIEATLDLHGLTKLDAYLQVQQFVMRAHCAKRRHVAIITGKGRAGELGVLRSNLPHWLNEPALRPLISAFATARAEKGGEGVLHVLLKRA